MAITKKGYLRTNNAYVLITILVTQFVFMVKLLVQDVGFEVGLKNKVDFRIIACATAPMFWKKSAHAPLDSSYRSSFCMMGTRTRFIGITPGYCCCCYLIFLFPTKYSLAHGHYSPSCRSTYFPHSSTLTPVR
ncbi:Uncharacterized protein HZ326_1949 [Fusarium oxysporum f. sp. albedinis]|nr:Uncharacterized protein HZ326_1949 [Fusarium oxysporum f. sp. albedinis]